MVEFLKECTEKLNSCAKKLLSQQFAQLLTPVLRLSPTSLCCPFSLCLVSVPTKRTQNAAPCLSACLPVTPSRAPRPLPLDPVSQASCWQGQRALEMETKVSELKPLAGRKKLEWKLAKHFTQIPLPRYNCCNYGLFSISLIALKLNETQALDSTVIMSPCASCTSSLFRQLGNL